VRAASWGSSQGSGFQGAADGIEDLVAVVGGFAHARIGPEGLHNLLAVEAVAWGQSQQLQEAPGVPQAPLVLFDEPRSNTQTKAAELPDAHHLKLVPPGSLSSGRDATVLELLRCWLALGTPSHPLSVSSSVSASRLGHWLSVRPSHPGCSSKEMRRVKSLYLTISCL
jgi:hypothetical protein